MKKHKLIVSGLFLALALMFTSVQPINAFADMSGPQGTSEKKAPPPPPPNSSLLDLILFLLLIT